MTMITTLVGFFSLIVIVLANIFTVYNWRVNRNTLYMGLFLALYALENLLYSFFIRGGSAEGYTYLYIIAPLYFAKAPFLYFFIRGLTADRFFFRKRDLLHFIPVLIQTVSNVPYFVLSYTEKVQISMAILNDIDSLKELDISWFYPVSWNALVRAFLFLVYILVSLRLIIQHNRQSLGVKKVISGHQHYVLKRLKIILLLTLGVALVSTVVGYAYVQFEQAIYTSDIYIRFIDIAMFLYFLLPLLLLFCPRLLYGLPSIQRNQSLTDNIERFETPVARKLQLEQSEKDGDSYLKTLAVIINEYIDREKPYLNKDFKINDISDSLKIPNNHVQYCLNVLMKKSFHEIKTEKRIEAAKAMLLYKKTLSVDEITAACGFGTVKHFHQHFRSATGLTPLKWRQLNSSKS